MDFRPPAMMHFRPPTMTTCPGTSGARRRSPAATGDARNGGPIRGPFGVAHVTIRSVIVSQHEQLTATETRIVEECLGRQEQEEEQEQQQQQQQQEQQEQEQEQRWSHCEYV